jgi:hypothetical protein
VRARIEARVREQEPDVAEAVRRAAGAEAEFAATLARALGPLYRITLIGRKGEAEATFGGFVGKMEKRARIPLPGSDRLLLIEVDERSLVSAARAIQALLAPGGDTEVPSGTFTHVDRAIDELIAMAEAQVGKPISRMTRSEKQSIVRFLDDRGAFAVRKSVETVAEALGVSRFTVYNYLDSIREE